MRAACALSLAVVLGALAAAQVNAEQTHSVQIVSLGPAHGTDDDGDGRFDYLDLPLRVRVQEGGQYNVSVTCDLVRVEPSLLWWFQKREIPQHSVHSLQEDWRPGEHALNIEHDGAMFHNVRANSFYQITVKVWRHQADRIAESSVGFFSHWQQFAEEYRYCISEGTVVTDLARCGPDCRGRRCRHKL